MSSLQRTAHVSGLNNPFPNQYAGQGSVYRPVGGGAPGILAGPVAGFTVAMGLHLPDGNGSDIWTQFGPPSPGGPPPYDPALPLIEFLVGCLNDDISDGWGILKDADFVEFFIGDASHVMADSQVGRDFMVMASYVGENDAYQGVGGPEACTGYNGAFDIDSTTAFSYSPQQEFVLGGIVSPAAAAIADSGNIGGAFRSGINSFWMTEGIPSIDQANDFMSQSMQAGQIIPQAWAPVRTIAEPNPATPANPTGHHWTASDLDLSQGLGGTWTDRISGVVLERVGAVGQAREYGKGRTYVVAGGLG